MKRLFYLMRILALLALAGASLFACSKDDKELIEQNDVEVVFTKATTSKLRPDSIQSVLKRPDVDNVYLVPSGRMDWGTQNINNIRTRALEPALALDPKRVHGRGDFWFNRGDCSVDDSLWFVKNGWTVNQKQH